MANKEIINKPWKYKNWMIWPNTVINELYFSNCEDAIKGVCLKNKSIKECIDSCSGDCFIGYHVTLPDKSTICVPIGDLVDRDINPLYILKPQSVLNLKRIEISTFINTDKISFPPKDVNTIFYKDIINIESIKFVGSYLGANSSDKVNNTAPVFTQDKFKLNFLTIDAENPVLQEVQKLNYNDRVLINIPGTDIILTQNDGLLWKQILQPFKNSNFFVVKSPSGKQGPVENEDEIIFETKGQFLTTDGKELKLSKVSDNTLANVFRINSMMKAYYCENNKCKSGPVKSVKDKKFATKSPFCLNLCDKNSLKFSNSPPKNRTWIYLIIIVIVLLAIFIPLFVLI